MLAMPHYRNTWRRRNSQISGYPHSPLQARMAWEGGVLPRNQGLEQKTLFRSIKLPDLVKGQEGGN